MEKKKDDDIIAAAVERLEVASAVESENRSDAVDDLQFLTGNQWPEELRRAREFDKRPCLTFNRLPAIIQQVTNDQRQNDLSIKIHPVGESDKEGAEIRQALIRQIESESNADSAQDAAVNSAASIGWGYFGLTTEYESETSMDQVIRFRRFRDAMKIYFDPDAQEVDGSDARWAMISDDMSRDAFVRQYPKASTSSSDLHMRGLGDRAAQWMNEKTVRVVEYYWIEDVQAKLCLYSDGSVRFKDDPELPTAAVVMPTTIVAERDTYRRRVWWAKLTAAEVLEKTEVPFGWIPIFPVCGTEYVVNGRVVRSGIVRYAKDPQRMYNFFMTSATEEVGLRPKSPYIMAAGQSKGYEAKWAAANVRNFPFLEYTPVTVDGVLAPAPQRQPMADVPSGLLMLARHASDDLKATTGIYDASLGAKGNETSGIAIRQRARQGDTANFHYTDNLVKSMRHAAKCILKAIPSVYDRPRIVRLMDEKGAVRSEQVNQPAMVQDEMGNAVEQVLNDLTSGTYDITISVGPAYDTLRQEASDSMTQVVQAFPQIMQFAGDLVAKSWDWPGADEIAKRLEKTLPPELRDKEEGAEGPPPPPPEMVQALEQASQAIEVYQQEIGQLQQALQAKDGEMQRAEEVEAAKMASVERIARAKLESEAQIDLLRIKKDLLIAREKAQAEQQTAMMTAAMQPAPVEPGGFFDDPAQIDLDAVSLDPMPVEPPPPPEPPQPTPTDVALMAVAEAMQIFARSMSAPKRPVRDSEGRIVQVITDMEPFNG